MSAVLSTVEAAEENQGAILDTRYIPVSQLVASPRNVRAKSSDKGDIPGLAAMIYAQGVLQNLSVVEAKRKGKKEPVFEVDAGERRRCALLLLLEQGKITPDYEVLCNIIDPSRGREVSLAENTRQQMNPADEMQAFADMINEGKTIEQIASIFGMKPLTVKRRLTLIGAAPELIEELRNGNITQEQLQALVICDDHARQVEVWNNADDWDRDPDSLRRAMTTEEISTLTDPVAAFVGLDAFEAAGGEVRRDLFSEEAGHGYIKDRVLLDKLAMDLLKPTCEALVAEGWSWVEARPVCSPQDLHTKFTVAKKGHREATAEEQAELDRINARQEEVQNQMEALTEAEDYDEEAYDRLSDEDDALDGQREALSQAMMVWSDDVKTYSGAIVTIKRGSPPTMLIHRGLIRREDAERAQGRSDDQDGADEGGDQQFGMQPAKPAKPEFSEGLTKRLTAHKTAALQVMLARNVQVGLASLAHNLVQQVLRTGTYYGGKKSALTITASDSMYSVRDAADDMKDSKAWQELEGIRSAWERRLPEEPKALLAWLLGLPILELQSLIAVCSALTVNCIQARPQSHDGDLLATAVGLDMADWWQATPESYFNHVPKAKMKIAVTEAMSESAAETLDKLKKGEAAAEASKLVEERRWLPSVLRTPAFVLVGNTDGRSVSDDEEGGEGGGEDEA